MKLQKMKLKDVRAVKCIPMREGESENMLNAQLSEFNGKIIAVAESNRAKTVIRASPIAVSNLAPLWIHSEWLSTPIRPLANAPHLPDLPNP